MVSDNVEGARRLLEAGASKGKGDTAGVTPQALAVRMNRVEIQQLICWVDGKVGASEYKPIQKTLTASEEREALTKRLTGHHAPPVPPRAAKHAVRPALPLLNLIGAGKAIIVFTTQLFMFCYVSEFHI